MDLRLLVQRGSVDSATQDWGEYSFVSAPSPGDRVAAEHGGKTHYLTVLSVHHKPVSATDNSSIEKMQQMPAADVVAIWTSSD